MIKDLVFYEHDKATEIIYYVLKILQFNYSYENLFNQISINEFAKEINSVVFDIQNKEKQDINALSLEKREKYIYQLSKLLSEKTREKISYNSSEGKTLLREFNKKIDNFERYWF